MDKEVSTDSQESAAAAGSSHTLAEQAFQQIADLILGGELAPGQILNEVDLARRFSMSRGPVREAIRRLEGRRLVVREPYQKARVMSFGAAEMREIFEFREGLELMACRLAARAMPDDVLERLAEAFKPQPGGAAGLPRHYDLHWEIAQHCGNARITDALCDEIYHLLRLYRLRSGDAGRRLEAREEHWQIVRALQSRDPDLAESLMRSHIRRASRHLESII